MTHEAARGEVHAPLQLQPEGAVPKDHIVRVMAGVREGVQIDRLKDCESVRQPSGNCVRLDSALQLQRLCLGDVEPPVSERVGGSGGNSGYTDDGPTLNIRVAGDHEPIGGGKDVGRLGDALPQHLTSGVPIKLGYPIHWVEGSDQVHFLVVAEPWVEVIPVNCERVEYRSQRGTSSPSLRHDESAWFTNKLNRQVLKQFPITLGGRLTGRIETIDDGLVDQEHLIVEHRIGQKP